MQFLSLPVSHDVRLSFSPGEVGVGGMPQRKGEGGGCLCSCLCPAKESSRPGAELCTSYLLSGWPL